MHKNLQVRKHSKFRSVSSQDIENAERLSRLLEDLNLSTGEEHRHQPAQTAEDWRNAAVLLQGWPSTSSATVSLWGSNHNRRLSFDSIPNTRLHCYITPLDLSLPKKHLQLDETLSREPKIRKSENIHCMKTMENMTELLNVYENTIFDINSQTNAIKKTDAVSNTYDRIAKLESNADEAHPDKKQVNRQNNCNKVLLKARLRRSVRLKKTYLERGRIRKSLRIKVKQGELVSSNEKVKLQSVNSKRKSLRLETQGENVSSIEDDKRKNVTLKRRSLRAKIRENLSSNEDDKRKNLNSKRKSLRVKTQGQNVSSIEDDKRKNVTLKRRSLRAKIRENLSSNEDDKRKNLNSKRKSLSVKTQGQNVSSIEDDKLKNVTLKRRSLRAKTRENLFSNGDDKRKKVNTERKSLRVKTQEENVFSNEDDKLKSVNTKKKSLRVTTHKSSYEEVGRKNLQRKGTSTMRKAAQKGSYEDVEGTCVQPANKFLKCGLCKKRFSDRISLGKHLHKHSDGQPLRCPICWKIFSQSASVAVHMRIHTGEKPYKCATCQRDFREKSKLVRHIRIHTGEKPYKCNLCKRCFNQSGSLNLHMRKFHRK